MMNMIKTQEGALVNLDNILQIVPQIFDFGDAAAYVLTAQPASIDQINNEKLDDCIQLCIYDSAEKLNTVLRSFTEWLDSSEHTIFAFPADITDEIEPFDMTFKDGFVYWKRQNGEMMKIGGSGSGKTRYFKKPDLIRMESL